MTTELYCLLLSTLLGFLHINAQVLTQRIDSPQIPYDPNRERGHDYGPRAARANRALRNFLESYPLFVALVLVVTLSGGNDWLSAAGAVIYLVGRTIYLPLYIAGTAPIRSAMWGVSFLGLAMMFGGALV